VRAQTQAARAGTTVPLKDVVAIALEHNRQIKSARLSLRSAELGLRTTRASYYGATFNADGTQARDFRADGTTRNDTLTSQLELSRRIPTGGLLSVGVGGLVNGSPLTPSSRVAQNYNLGFSQPFLRGFGPTVTNAPLVQDQNNLRSATDRLAQTITDTIGRVEAAYWNLLLQSEAVTLQASAMARSQQLKTTTEALIAAGRAARNDLVRTESDIASQEVSLAAARLAVHQAQNQLREVLDTDGLDEIAPAEPDSIDPRPVDLKASLDAAFTNRPDWRVAERDLANSALSVRVARNSRLYDLALVGNLTSAPTGRSFSDAWSGFGDQRSTNLAVRLVVPINNTSANVAAEQADLSYQQAEMSLAEQRQQLEIEVDDAVSRVNQELQQLDLTKRARELAEQALQVELEKLRVGRSTNFNVVQLQNEVNVAMHSELSARISYLLARSALERATGATLAQWKISVQ
jgi:outer membrane protein TolC